VGVTIIRVAKQDIATVPADALVNSTDAYLSGREGLDAHIHRLAGPDLSRACAQIGECKVGEAQLTPGYQLPVKYVVHAVGPHWQLGALGALSLLANTYTEALSQAASMGCRVVTLPAISTGLGAIPLPDSAPVVIGALSLVISQPPDWFEELIMCVTTQEGLNAYAHFIGSNS